MWHRGVKLKPCFQHKGCLMSNQVLFVVIVKGESTQGTREGFAASQIVYRLFFVSYWFIFERQGTTSNVHWSLINNAEFDRKCIVLWCFQIGVEQTITQCKKQSSWISYIALKTNKEKLAEQKNLVSSYLYLIFDWFKAIKVEPGGAITSVFGSEICVGFSGIGLIPFTVNYLLRVQDNSRKTVNRKNCSPRNRNR